VLVGLGAGYWAFGTAGPAASHGDGPALVTAQVDRQLPVGSRPFVLPGEDLSAQVEVTESERGPRGPSSSAGVPLVASSASVEKPPPGTASPEAPAPLSFYEELTYLRRAQAALRKKEPALAFGLMQSLDGLNTAGALLSERAMTKVLALCLLDRVQEATEVARQLATAEGGGLYVDRISHSCAAATVSASGPTETVPAAEASASESTREEQASDARE
jgi:hypothetical protein